MEINSGSVKPESTIKTSAEAVSKYFEMAFFVSLKKSDKS